MSTRVIFSIVVVGVLLGLPLFFFFGPSDPHPKDYEAGAHADSQSESLAPGVLPSSEVPVNRSVELEIEFIDILDNTILIPSSLVSLEIDGELQETFTIEELNEERAKEDSTAFWVVMAPVGSGSGEVRTSLAKSSTQVQDQFAVSCHAGIRPTLIDSHGDLVSTLVSLSYCVLDPNVYMVIREEAANPKNETIWSVNSSERLIEAYQEISGDLEVHSVRNDSDEFDRIILDKAGVLVTWASSFGMGGDWIATEVFPGEMTDIALRLRQRPRVEGFVYGTDGLPEPDATISIIVSFGTVPNPDLGSGDVGRGMGVAAAGQRGAMNRIGRLGVRANSEGWFSLVVPRGEYYAVEAILGPSYGFSRTMDIDFGQKDTVILDVHLIGGELPPDEDQFVVRVTDEVGNPIEGVSVLLVVVDDLLWMRQFLSVISDTNGIAPYPWIPAGTTVTPFLSLPEGRFKDHKWRGGNQVLNGQSLDLALELPSPKPEGDWGSHQ